MAPLSVWDAVTSHRVVRRFADLGQQADQAIAAYAAAVRDRSFPDNSNVYR